MLCARSCVGGSRHFVRGAIILAGLFCLELRCLQRIINAAFELAVEASLRALAHHAEPVPSSAARGSTERKPGLHRLSAGGRWIRTSSSVPMEPQGGAPISKFAPGSPPEEADSN